MPAPTILVALELSPSDGPVLEAARTYARALDGQLRLVHVVAPEPEFVGLPREAEARRDPDPQGQAALATAGIEVGYAYDRSLKARHLREAHEVLQEAGREEAHGIETTSLLVEGLTADRILEEAERLNVALIIMGSHQRGALGNWLFGSDSQGVARSTSRPVLLVPVPDA